MEIRKLRQAAKARIILDAFEELFTDLDNEFRTPSRVTLAALRALARNLDFWAEVPGTANSKARNAELEQAEQKNAELVNGK